MKLFGLLTILASLFQCASISFDKNPPFTINNAVYQNYVGGVAGVSGINLTIDYTATTNIAFDSIFFKDKKAKIVLQTENKKTILKGHFSTSTVNSKDDLILHEDGKKEYGNKPHEEKTKFELKENEAVISYIVDGKTNYFKVENVKKGETIYYPSAKPK